MTTYYLTHTGAARINKPVGTVLIRTNPQSDVYRILAPGESFFNLADGSSECKYGLSMLDASLSDPTAQRAVGPWGLNTDLCIDMDRLPNGKNMLIGYNLNDAGNVCHLTLCIDDLYVKSLEDNGIDITEIIVEQAPVLIAEYLDTETRIDKKLPSSLTFSFKPYSNTYQGIIAL